MPASPSLGREMARTGLPIFAELFCISLFFMADMAVLKPCGTTAIAAVGLTSEPVNLLEFAFFALQTAVIARLSAELARREGDAVRKTCTVFCKLCTAAALLLALVVAFAAEPLLRLFGADSTTLPLAAAYLRLSLPAFVCRRVYNGLTAILKALDAPQWSFIVNASANALNIALDLALIYGLGPFPALGPVGAAVATSIACAAAMLWSAVLLLRRCAALGLPLRPADWHAARLPDQAALLRDALPYIGEKVMVRLGTFLSITQIALLGTTAFAAYRMVVSIQYFPFLAAEALSTTVLIFVSRAFALGDRQTARQAGRLALSAGILIALAFSLTFVFAGGLWMFLYTDDPAVRDAGIASLRTIALFQPFQAAALVLAGMLRGCKLARIPTVITTIGIVGLRPALIWLLSPTLGVVGVWVAISTDEIFRLFALLTCRGRIGRAFDRLPPQTQAVT